MGEPMPVLHYKDHTIITSATRDEQTGKYIPLASLRWETPDRSRHVEIVNPRKLYFTRDAALEVALKEAFLRIDLQKPATQARAQTEAIINRVTFGEAALQPTHRYKESAAQRELAYPAKLNIRV
jgi:hypothetical protein